MNTFRKAHVLLLAGTLVLTQSSCEKLLDLKPQDRISDASFWNTPNDFMLAANTFYTYERTFNQVLYDIVPNTSTQNYHADIRADFAGGQNTYSRGLNTLLTTDPVYNTSYSRIRTINYLLDRAQAYARPDEIKKYVAEAKFFRAYVYFDLLQTYGAVPIVDKLLQLESQELQLPQNTREQVVDFLVKDLEAAIVDLPLKTAQDANTELGRVNREAANAFLGRVALYEGTWQKFRGNTARGNTLLDRAITASNAVITSAQYTLFGQAGTVGAVLGDSAQKYMFILENQKSNPANITKTANSEYILANRYDQTSRQLRNNASRQANQTGVTHGFANQFLCQDGLPVDKSPLFRGYGTTTAEYINRDNRMRYTLKVPGRTYWYSGGNARVNWTGDATDRAAGVRAVPNGGSGYGSQKWVAERAFPDNEEGYDYPVIRYAEVLLNYAEAMYERSGNISNTDLDRSLNLVRNRVNRTMPKLSNALVSANGLDMREEIRRERNVELFLEGFRLDDLKRWNIAEQELRKPLVGIRWRAGTDYATAWPTAASLPKDANGSIIVDAAGNRQFGSRNYLIPLPTEQLQRNPQLQQNTGW